MKEDKPERLGVRERRDDCARAQCARQPHCQLGQQVVVRALAGCIVNGNKRRAFAAHQNNTPRRRGAVGDPAPSETGMASIAHRIEETRYT